MEKIKKCSRCKTEYPATKEYFYTHKETSDRLTSNCKKCSGISTRSWAKRNPDRIREYQRTFNLKRKGLEKEAYDEMCIEQNWRCKICGITEREHRKRFHIDHDHKTGKTRGLLCVNCNLGLGNFKDNPLSLIKGVKYLLSYN